MAPVFLDAARKGITVVAPAGDGGAAPTEQDGKPVRGVSWPASDPSVFAVGGLRLGLDDEGRRTDPDVVWEDRAGASGGGVSEVFARPSYQNRVEPAVGDRRGVPDLSLTASGDGSTMIHFTEDGKTPTWVPMAGTSLAAPSSPGSSPTPTRRPATASAASTTTCTNWAATSTPAARRACSTSPTAPTATTATAPPGATTRPAGWARWTPHSSYRR